MPWSRPYTIAGQPKASSIIPIVDCNMSASATLSAWMKQASNRRSAGYDNALAESVIGLFKTEVIHRLGPWKSLEAVDVIFY